MIFRILLPFHNRVPTKCQTRKLQAKLSYAPFSFSSFLFFFFFNTKLDIKHGRREVFQEPLMVLEILLGDLSQDSVTTAARNRLNTLPPEYCKVEKETDFKRIASSASAAKRCG